MTGEPTILEDRFALGAVIGRGSLSVVHQAVDRATGREVAVKLSDTADDDHTARGRFDREAAALSVIASAHVVELIAAGTAPDGRPFLVLERLRGHNLQQALVEHGPLSSADTARVIGEAAAALELAHALGIVHRDLKPANLFEHQTADGPLVKVLDFGLVVDVAGPGDRGRDGFGGTPLYMAPEQVRGQISRIGPATDVWALAMVTVTLLTGESYWPGATSGDVMREIESSPLRAPSQRWPWLPGAFDRWFAASTRRVPERRFREVSEQAAQLAAALRGVSVPQRRVPAATADDSTGLARTPLSGVRRVRPGSTLIGRGIELAEIEARLTPATVVTLTGTAGVGKTRLAQALCDAAGDRFVDGTWFVPLAAADAAEAAVGAIAATLELEPDAARPGLDHLAASLAPRRMLIVLDGVDHAELVLDLLDRLRRQAPAVSWLVTARRPLGVSGEVAIGIDPLDLPDPTEVDPGEATTFSAIELFAHEARQVDQWFTVNEDNVADVVAICRATEGFPLDIELAAARLQTTPLADIRAALDQARPAQAGLVVRNALAWSYGLLAPAHQTLLRHLALLPAGLTFDQVQHHLAHVVDDPAGAVMRLIESHLLRWTGDTPRRLVMLDTVRDLCRDATRDAGDQAALWRVACEHAGEVAERAAAGQDPAGLASVDAEHPNLVVVLGHLLDSDPAAAMRLAGQLAWYWYVRGHYRDGAAWLAAAIDRTGHMHGEDLTRALYGAGRLAMLTCQYARAANTLEWARALAHAAGDQRGEAAAVQLLGSVARERGDYDLARTLHREGLDLWQQLGDERECHRARNYLLFAAWLGDAAGDPGEHDRAWWQVGGDAELRRVGDPEAIAWWYLNRGAILHHAGQRDAARAALGQAFAGSVAARYREGIAWSLDLIGRASLERGDLVQARAQLTASLRVHRRLGDLWRCASVLEALAAVSVARDHPARAAVYLGAAEAVRRQLVVPIPTCERALVDATIARGTALLDDGFEVGRERGRRTPLDHTVALTRDQTQ